MKGYLIANITVHDPDAFATYRERVAAVVEKFGGRYLVRGGAMERVEQATAFNRLTVIEFPSVEDATAFYRSPDYAPVLAIREAAAHSDVVIIAGTAGTSLSHVPDA